MTELFGQDAEGIIPYVGQMLSIKLEEQYQEHIRHAAPEQIRRQTLLRMRDFFVALARRHPLAVILEDLHWADDLSLDLLWVLMDELVAAPILLVCIYRPEQEHGCWQIESAASSKHLERYTPLHLKPLTQQESQQMVASLLAIQDLPPATRAAILQNTEGNPFFVEEVVRLLIERGIIYREEGQWKAKEAIGELEVPDTVKSVILSRVDRLQQEVRSVLQCAAVIGRVFQHRLLEYLSGQKEALEQYLSQLVAYELVYKERIVPELEYAFKHALTQETAYEAMLTRHRKAFHQRVGEAIEALYEEQIEEYYELLAYHYSRSDHKEKAIEYLVKAGQKAAARYANQEALGYLEEALKLAEGAADDATILAHRARVLLDIFRGKEAASDYTQLLQSARENQDRERELKALLGLASACYVIALDGREPDAASRSRELYEAAYTLARELGDRANMVRALVPTLWFLDFWPEYRAQAAANADEALALSQEIGDEDLIIDSKLAPFPYLRGLDAEEERELIDQLEARHDLLRLKDFYYRLMWMHLGRGHYERSIECCDAGIKLASETGVPPVQYPTIKALALMNLGRYGEAYTSLQNEVAGPEHALGTAMKALGTGVYCLELMAYDRASEICGQVLDQARRLRRAWMRRWCQAVLAKSLIRAGRLDRAGLDSITQDLESIGSTLPEEVLAELLLSEGRLEEALQAAERSASLAEERSGKPGELAALELKLRVLLRQDRPADAIRLADELLPMAEGMSYLPMVWRLRAAGAQAQAALGNRAAASEEYQSAATVIQRLADTIPDAGLKAGFMADPLVASILAAARGPVPGNRE